MKINQGNEAQANPIDDSKPYKNHNNDDDKKYENSTSDIGSSGENISNHFDLFELRGNVASAITIVDSLDQKVIGLDLKIDQKVTSLDKLVLILKSLFDIQVVAPLELDRAN